MEGEYKKRIYLNLPFSSKHLNQIHFFSDFIIKLVNLNDHSIKQINGHQAPILSLKFDPKRKYLVSSSCDGSVQIWNINDLENIKSVKKFDNNHKKSNDFSNSSTLCSSAWNTDGNLLAIPNDSSINFYERDVWINKFCLKYDNFNLISICEFDSNNGNYFAASNSNGVLIVWNLNFKDTPISIYVNEGNALITCFKFNPLNKEKLIASDKNGQLIYLNIKQDVKMKKLEKEVDNKYAAIDDFDEMDDEFDDAAFMKDLDAIDYNLNNKKKDSTKPDFKTDDFNDDNFSDDLNNFNGIEEEEKEILHREKFTLSKFSNAKKKNRVIDSDEDNSNTGQSDLQSNTQNTTNLDDIDPVQFDNKFEDDDEDDELIDIGALKQKYEAKINKPFDENITTEDERQKETTDNNDKDDHKIVNFKFKPIMQPAFQPSSTPVELENRFMVWNSVGIVSCTRTETENMIDVEFHNSDIYRSMHLPNTYNYTMADLNTDSLLLAAPLMENESNKEDSTASVLFCMNFNSWDNNKEWRYQLPLNESIEAITLSTNFVLVATDHRQIRLFTISGIQLHLFSIPGPVICLTCQDNLVQIIYHNGSGLPGEQAISMSLLELNDRSFYPLTQLTNNSQIPVCLSPKSVIEWAGFSDEGSACIVDSNGLVKLFNLNSNCWIPVVDLKAKNKKNNYFVISLSEIQEQVRCISCKEAKYPSTIPKPDVYNLPFEIPLCELTTTKAKLEEQLIRTSLKKRLLENLSSSGFDVGFSNDENTKKQIELLIKLFALAVNADCNSLAIEVAGLMPNQLAIEGAIRYASQKNRTVLINKLNKLSKEKFNTNSNSVSENEEEDSRHFKKSKKRQASNQDEDDILRPKQIKLTNDKNPFRVR